MRQGGRSKLSGDFDRAYKRMRIQTVPLRGTGCMEVKAIRERLKRGSGVRRYVYKSHPSAREIVIANHEIPGRTDLVGVYDRRVTAEMVRVDILNQRPDGRGWVTDRTAQCS